MRNKITNEVTNHIAPCWPRVCFNMADIYFSLQDTDETQEEEDPNSNMAIEEATVESLYTSEELLSPFAKMQKYMNSDNIYNRQMVVRCILETLRSVVESKEDTATVINIMYRLSDDEEPSIRAELMEQIPHIAMFCHEYHDRLYYAASQYLLPVIVKYLADPNNQVRKTSQAALLVLLEQYLVNKNDVEKQVCPLILQLTFAENDDDFRTEAVALMSKMAPLIGKETTERLFLKSFASLCMDSLFQVRKVCAANFGDFCNVVGTEPTENLLLPRFSFLCDDSAWGVKKACADVFTAVSYCCSPEVRRRELAPLFIKLLRDPSQWVRMAAYQALGPFISSFADPKFTGIYFTEKGLQVTSLIEDEDNEEITLLSNPSEEDGSKLKECSSLMEEKTLPTKTLTNSSNSSEDTSAIQNNPEKLISLSCDIVNTEKALDNALGVVQRKELKNDLTKCLSVNIEDEQQCSDSLSQLNASGSQRRLHLHVDNENAFNSFHFWRVPIPDIELDIDIVGGKPTNVHVKAKVHSEEHKRVYSSELNVLLSESENRVLDSSTKIDVQELPLEIKDLSLDNETLVTDNKALDEEQQQTGSSQLTIQTPIHPVTHDSNKEYVLQDVAQNTGVSMNESFVTIINGELKSGNNVHRSCLDLRSDSVQSPRKIDPITETCIYKQNIVPHELLIHYISMSDPSQVETLDSEITRHCAYSLPAVAMTLGRKNWSILKNLYEALAVDMQWKVRRALAFSIHELAMILGEDISMQDLVPIFNGFIKDLDEVRIGILKHLAHFLKCINEQERRKYLPKLVEFLNNDNKRNWRFRLELTEQLGSMAELYTPVDIRDYLVPIAILLVTDRVAKVRQIAFKIISLLVKNMRPEEDSLIVKTFLSEIAEQFAYHRKWNRRQTFAFLCNHFVLESSLSLQQFADDLLPHLLHLSNDPVPNVRLSVARTLSQTIIPMDYYSSQRNPHQELLLDVVKRLQTDEDRDVRYFAALSSQNLSTINLLVPPV